MNRGVKHPVHHKSLFQLPFKGRVCSGKIQIEYSFVNNKSMEKKLEWKCNPIYYLLHIYSCILWSKWSVIWGLHWKCVRVCLRHDHSNSSQFDFAVPHFRCVLPFPTWNLEPHILFCAFNCYCHISYKYKFCSLCVKNDLIESEVGKENNF